MLQEARTDYLTRDGIMKLLSDDEIAGVSTAEGAVLLDGEEYVDLEQIGRGVQRASGLNAPIGGALPRRAVQDGTWTKILHQLQLGGVAAVYSHHA